MGINSLLQQNLQNAGLTGIDRLASNAMFPQSKMDKTQYAVPNQLPTSAETISSDYDAKTDAYTGLPTQPFKRGGIARFVEGGPPEGKVWSETQGDWVDPGPNSGAMPGAMPIGSNVTPVVEMPTIAPAPAAPSQGLPSLSYAGPTNRQAIVEDLYQKMLGRSAKEGEANQWIDYLDTENPNQGIMALADRLAQTEEGTAYGKKNPKDVYKAVAALSQADSPFAGMDTPYSNMRYAGTSNKTNYGGETTPDSVTTTHMFQDENGGIVTTDQFGQPIEYSPGRGWYEEQLRKKPDALRNYGYRNQTYLAAGPLDKTYNFNGVDVPISAAEYQVDPKTKQLITGKTGDFKPLELKPQDYSWFDDWGAPAMVVAIPALAAAGAAAAGAYGAGAVGGGLGAAEGATTLGSLGAGGAFTPVGGASFGITPGSAYTAAGAAGAAEAAGAGAGSAASQGFGLKDAYNAYKYANLAKNVLGMTGALGGGSTGYTGQGLNPNSGYIPFNPGVRAGLPIGSGYEKTPWANMAPPITLSKLSDFAPEKDMASGGLAGLGHLGGYSDGGRLLKGPGDGMSDNIPASIDNKQPARLADGEFVIPADVVSHLGNGSTDAGAKQLYAMMDKVREARTGNKKQGKQIKPSKFLPKG